MNFSYAPIAVFAYKRKEHFKKVIEALAECELAADSEVFICIDGPRNANDKYAVQEVLEYAETLKTKNYFKKTHIECKQENYGLSQSIISGVSGLLKKYGKIIVLEDDIVVRDGFLEFMNRALEYYKNRQEIWSISSYSPPLKCLQGQDNFLYLSYRGNCWGWASWADRWEKIDWDVMDYSGFMFSYQRRKEFNWGGKDLSRMLDAYMAGAIDSWAVRWNYAQYKEKKLSVAPAISFIENIGFDGSGENCGLQVRMETANNKEMKIRSFDYQFNREIVMELKMYYDKLYPVHIRWKKQMKSLMRRIWWRLKNWKV